MELLLGLDVGTTATKALAFDRTGVVVSAASHPNPLLTPRPGWVEQDPEALWQGVVTATRTVVDALPPHDRIVALALSSQAGTTIPVDAAGQPVHNAISWMDGRAVEECEHVRRAYGADALYRTTGWRLWAGLPLQHIAWLRTHCPAECARARHFLFVNDFIGQRLSGVPCMDPQNAGLTLLMALETGDWDEDLLALAGIRRDQLSPIRPAGTPVSQLTGAAAAATGLPTDALLINGSHDTYCAALGLGITRPGQTMLSCGTAWAILALPETRALGLRSGMRISRHPLAARWGAVLSLGGVGASLEWLLRTAWEGEFTGRDRRELYRAANTGAAQSPVGAAGLWFFPLAGGHPERGEQTWGAFHGLGLSHNRNDMTRAVMESLAYELRWTLDEIRAAGIEVEQLTMTGGAARSPIWPHIVADVTGLPVTVTGIAEAASWGAAMLAGVGSGAWAGVEEAIAAAEQAQPGENLEPDANRHAEYCRLYARYRQLSAAVLGAGI